MSFQESPPFVQLWPPSDADQIEKLDLLVLQPTLAPHVNGEIPHIQARRCERKMSILSAGFSESEEPVKEHGR